MEHNGGTRDMWRGVSSKPEIQLLEPGPGEVTVPLALHTWQVGQGRLSAPGGYANREESQAEGSETHMPGAPNRLPRHGHGPFGFGPDRSAPRPVRFAWQAPGGAASHYTLTLTAQDGSGETFTRRGLVESSTEMVNLRIGTHYGWQVTAQQGEMPVGQSAVGYFSTHAAPPRWISAPGATNVRDVGGWSVQVGGSVRQGLLFRGSELNSHCQITAQGRKVLEDDLGIRSDVDLRGSGEECLPALDAAHVQYVNIPLASYDMIASPEYTRRYRQVFGLLALPAAYPIYLHCWGGADRTGTVCFLLGALLGMREADLELDYELTSLSVWGERSIASEAYQEMRQTLALFAHKGSPLQHQVERYFRVIGVTPQEVASIRAIFLK